ncbi:hypothetical protein FDG2_1893 [Candidatus Protofrankia californiensis]|uniref:Uncharacterized protein n=1 Tax=Candidatus Protofrankia californiensis TaxID=1839754 RepID=A0A1C3NWK5_9ACTN|nr:hypothetical protein FDG2_1893 [Candidatus Protofrankia californiensis]
MTTSTPLAFTPVTASTLGLPAPTAVSAAIPLFVIALLLWRRVLPRLAAILALLAGAALTDGWLHIVIHAVLGAITTVINVVTRTTMGGVVPGAVAIVMAIYYVLELRLDAETVNRLLARKPRLGRTRDPYGWAPGRLALTVGSKPRWPRRLGALAVGLALPSVVTTIQGPVGAGVTSAVNILGGLMAVGLDHTIGIR